ncbi:sulfatase-like hydrolase/transferase [Halorubrum sp. AS12]|uniref:sulfatase-like hydrolase/transferase n=1 Tax=Halorubrum sp. AS12 TaxID=3409687 RepID=UPI003DA71CB2
MSENIVLVSIDSLRADYCGFMGHEGGITPTLDSMAKDAIVFENATSPGPRTPESMPGIFTGEFVSDDLPTDMVPQRELINKHMERHRTLPEQLSEMGYTTIGLTPNPFTSRFFGFDRGFDYFQDFIGDSSDGFYQRLFKGWLGGDTVSNVLRLSRNMIQREEVFKPWESFYDEAISEVQDTEEPYFLWVFLMDVHEPYMAGDGFRSTKFWERWSAIWRLYLGDKESPFDEKTTRRLIRAYEDSIEYTDAFFDRLLDDLR